MGVTIKNSIDVLMNLSTSIECIGVAYKLKEDTLTVKQLVRQLKQQGYSYQIIREVLK